MNLIQLMGRLGADAETRFTPSGQKVTTLRIACNSKRGGEEETIWYRVTLWSDRWDKLLPYLTKGSAVIVHGELRKPEVYTDRNGNPAVSMDVTADSIRFNPFGGRNQDEQQQHQQHQQPAQYGGAPAAAAPAAAASTDPWAQATPATQPGTAAPTFGQPAFGEPVGAPMSGSQSVSEDDVPF